MSRTTTIGPAAPLEIYEDGDFFRLLDAPGLVTVLFYKKGALIAEAVNIGEGYAERWRNGGFDRIRIASATNQTIQFVTRLGAEVLYDAPPVGDTAIVSSIPLTLGAPVDLTAATINGLNRPELSTGFRDATALAAAANAQVFAPAANVNGAIVWSAFHSYGAAGGGVVESLIAKAGAAPANYADGQVLMCSRMSQATNPAYYEGQLVQPVRIAAGLGLWFHSSGAQSAGLGQIRACQYTLL